MGPVYPRWRGEHLQPAELAVAVNGLSPLARGTRHRDLHVNRVSRFIPAGAGNTVHNCYHTDLKSVYPRWRGEHGRTDAYSPSGDGLSPLARGTHHPQSEHIPGHRFIPAGAGNTLPRVLPEKNPAVYPRWRGEHSTPCSNPSSTAGLSPLARGTPGYCSLPG